MSMLSKLLSRIEPPNGDDEVKVTTNKTMRPIGQLKVGDEIIIQQRVRIEEIADVADKRIGSLGDSSAVYMQIKAVGGVFNNLRAVASAHEKDKVEVAKGQVKANAAPRITSEASDEDREDEMHGSYSPLVR